MSINKKYFGTDGIRGRYGEKITGEIAYKLGNTLGAKADKTLIIVGRDTRVSGKELAHQLIQGILETGTNVIDLGIVSTPAVAHVTEENGATYGIVISASHNPWDYNGLKIFDTIGRKLTDEEELNIEHDMDTKHYIADGMGKIKHSSHAIDGYYNLLRKVGGNLTGLKIGIDSANGAVSSHAAKIMRELGAEVVSVNDSGDGRIINKECGALHPEVIGRIVREQGLDMGFAFDGDADRVLAVDRNGRLVDGDAIIYIIATMLKAKGALVGDVVVGTHHTNLGVENCLKEQGIILERTDIGDHYVAERMGENGALVGGEQSGHIILKQFANTGDGLLAALYIASIVKKSGKELHELVPHEVYPQVNYNITVDNNKKIISRESVRAKEKECADKLGKRGRILLRASGTEPKIRIMVEAKDGELARNIADELKHFIESEAKKDPRASHPKPSSAYSNING